MRDAIEILDWAEHGRAWSDWLYGVVVGLRRALSWAGKGFTTEGLRRAG